MDEGIKYLRQEIPKALESKDYENLVNEHMSQNTEHQLKSYSKLEMQAKKLNFQVRSTKVGIETFPIVNGKTLNEGDYETLNSHQRKKIEKDRIKLEPCLAEFARMIRTFENQSHEFIKELQTKIVKKITTSVFFNIASKYTNIKEVALFLNDIELNLIENIQNSVREEFQTEANEPKIKNQEDFFKQYKINLFVDNKSNSNAPVVFESNPTYYNIFGKIEKKIENGVFTTDFSLIKQGSIHKANGGYLVLEAQDIFKNQHVWESLKKVLKAKRCYIEEISEQGGFFTTSGLRPEPIPLDIKIILLGSNELYHTLYAMDEEFQKLFKIKAEFDFQMPRTSENIKAYASFIATRCQKENLLPFDKQGVASVVEYGSRLVENKKKLSTHFGDLKDLTIESDFIARRKKARLITREHVEAAINEKKIRLNLFEEQFIEYIKNESINLSVSGTRIGQINCLTVYELGDFAFGRIGRVTCTAFVRKGGILNIERASKLSGSLHDKGIHIITGFIHALLAQKTALGLSASVCFEQSYGVVDGDSATTGELIAIISAMSHVPIKQNVGVTGSLNQLGDIQAVGGINEKIEGFLKCCHALGKITDLVMIIPEQNVINLMLEKKTREQIQKGNLRIFPVKFFWQAFEIATGIPFGIKDLHETAALKGSALEKIQLKSAHIIRKNPEPS